MKLPRYEYVTESEAELFKFTSEGTKGSIKKLVVYSQMLQRDIYNLAFGDYDEETNSINDTVITNNNDSQKVLAPLKAGLLQLYMFLFTNIQTYGFMQQAVTLQEQDFIEWELLQTSKKF